MMISYRYLQRLYIDGTFLEDLEVDRYFAVALLSAVAARSSDLNVCLSNKIYDESDIRVLDFGITLRLGEPSF